MIINAKLNISSGTLKIKSVVIKENSGIRINISNLDKYIGDPVRYYIDGRVFLGVADDCAYIFDKYIRDNEKLIIYTKEKYTKSTMAIILLNDHILNNY